MKQCTFEVVIPLPGNMCITMCAKHLQTKMYGVEPDDIHVQDPMLDVDNIQDSMLGIEW